MTTLILPVVLGISVCLLAVAWQGLPPAPGAGPPQRTPFTGGAAPTMHAWQRYHVRYYPMVLLFLAFEMEMMFMYPWAVVYVAEGGKALMEMLMFLSILSVGILYGWRERCFAWQ
jgi:NADH:ubiquinone oxidoreductase subunit 3 (subunit A)